MTERLGIVWSISSFMGLMMIFQAKKREKEGLEFGRFEQIMVGSSSVLMGSFGVLMGLKMMDLKVSDKFKAMHLGILVVQALLLAIVIL